MARVDLETLVCDIRATPLLAQSHNLSGKVPVGLCNREDVVRDQVVFGPVPEPVVVERPAREVGSNASGPSAPSPALAQTKSNSVVEDSDDRVSCSLRQLRRLVKESSENRKRQSSWGICQGEGDTTEQRRITVEVGGEKDGPATDNLHACSLDSVGMLVVEGASSKEMSRGRPKLFSADQIDCWLPIKGNTKSQGLCTEVRQVFPSLSNYISDAGIRNSNSLFWLKEEEKEAMKLWGIAKTLGANLLGCDEVLIQKLVELEKKDGAVYSNKETTGQGGVAVGEP